MERTTYRSMRPACELCAHQFPLAGVSNLLLGRIVACNKCSTTHQVTPSKTPLAPSRSRLFTLVLIGGLLGMILGDVVALVLLVFGLCVVGLSLIRERLDRISAVGRIARGFDKTID
jgi:hypothetical protein